MLHVYKCIYIHNRRSHAQYTFSLIYFLLDTKLNSKTFGWPNWFDNVKDEVSACRSRAAVFDLTSQAKFILSVRIHVYRSLSFEHY